MLRRTVNLLPFCALALFPVSASPQTRQAAPLHDTQAWADLTVSHALSENTDVLFSGGIRWTRHLNSDRKSTRLNSSHQIISYAVFCLKKKKKKTNIKST